MNNDLFAQSLNSSAESAASVSDDLHQRVMRKVRLSTASVESPSTAWTIPAWSAAMAATAAVFLILAQPAKLMLDKPHDRGITLSLSQLEGKLIALSRETALPEAELREELRRLKADLEKFTIGS